MPKGVPNRRYTPEFKKQVVETMQEEKLSCCETARQFEISDESALPPGSESIWKKARRALP